MVKEKVTEIWKDIKGWEKYYQVSNYGRVKDKRDGRLLLHLKTVNRPVFVRLSAAGKRTAKRLRSLVAETFLEKPVNHGRMTTELIDGNEDNCAASNIRWVPVSRKQPVCVYDKNRGLLHSYPSVEACSIALQISWDTIGFIINSTDKWCGALGVYICREGEDLVVNVKYVNDQSKIVKASDKVKCILIKPDGVPVFSGIVTVWKDPTEEGIISVTDGKNFYDLKCSYVWLVERSKG